MLVVTLEQEDELRAFCNLVSRRAPHGNELAWALRRFELGCERESAHEALTDHLLALRAVLEPEGQSSGLLAARMAALCATPEQRLELTERMLAALALEQAVIAGRSLKRGGGQALMREVADHLRALLRDVICGHLSSDLPSLADELLASQQRGGDRGRRRMPKRTQRPSRACPSASPSCSEPPSGEQVRCHEREPREILDVLVEVRDEDRVALLQL